MKQLLKSVCLFLIILFPFSGSALNVSLPSMTGLSYGQSISVAITTEDLTGQNVYAYLTKITYDQSLFTCTGVTKSGTLSSSWSNPTINTSVPGEISIAAYGAFPLSGTGTLIYLNFNVIAQSGLSALDFSTFVYNEGTPAVSAQNGSLMIGTVLPLSLSLSSQDPSCYGYTDGSTDLTVSGGTPPISYSWSNGTSTQDLNSIGQGTYSVTVSDASSSLDTSIVLNEPPAVFLNISIDTSICQGDSLVVDLGSGYYTYDWSNGNTSQTITLSSTANISGWITDASGCPSNDSAHVLLSVHPLPGSAGVISGPDFLCPGANTATYSAGNIADATSYSWTLPQGISGSSTSNTIQVLITAGFGGGTISVAGENECGQGSISNLNVGVYSTVVVDLGSDQTISSGSSANIQAIGSGGSSPYTYAWSNGGTSSAIIVSPTVTTSYSVTITDQNGCTATDNITVNVTGASGPNVQVPLLSSCPGATLSVPVIANDFQSIGSISLSLIFDPAVLSYTGYQSQHPNLSSGLLVVNSSANKVQLAWFSVMPIALDGDTLIEFNFSTTIGSSALSWDINTPGACYVTDENNTNIQVSYSNGSATIANCSNLNGVVYYDNSTQSVLSNTNVMLQESGQQPIQQLSGADGSFLYQNLNTATYSLTASPTLPWGGVNAADALLVMRHFVGYDTLTGLSEVAADVDASTFINAGDALMIARRFVNLVNSFPSGDWACEEHQIVITGSGDVTENVGCILMGDVDRSAVFAPKK